MTDDDFKKQMDAYGKALKLDVGLRLIGGLGLVKRPGMVLAGMTGFEYCSIAELAVDAQERYEEVKAWLLALRGYGLADVKYQDGKLVARLESKARLAIEALKAQTDAVTM